MLDTSAACGICGARWHRYLGRVCSCGANDCWIWPEPEAAREAPIVRMDQIAPGSSRRLPSGDEALDALLQGGWCPGELVLVHGPRGSGKSRATMRWSSRIGPGLVVGLEMPAELTRHSAAEAGADLGALHLVTTAAGWESAARSVRARSIVVDSLSRSDAPDLLGRARRWTERTGGVAWLLAHESRRGHAKGSTDQDHDVDTIVRIAHPCCGSASLAISKRRRGPPGACRVPVQRAD